MEDYKFLDEIESIVQRIDTGAVFFADESQNSDLTNWNAWQAWIALGNTTHPYELPVQTEPVQWALDNAARAKFANRVLWRLVKSYKDQARNAQNTLLDALGILADASNTNKVYIFDAIVARKNLEGISAALTIANLTTDVGAMSNADRRELIEICETVCLTVLTSAVAGPGLAED